MPFELRYHTFCDLEVAGACVTQTGFTTRKANNKHVDGNGHKQHRYGEQEWSTPGKHPPLYPIHRESTHRCGKESPQGK